MTWCVLSAPRRAEKRISRTREPLRRVGDDPHTQVTYGAHDGRAAHARRALRRPPRLRLRTALRRGRRGDGGTLRVHYLDEGPRRTGRAVDARRAVVVLPLPQDDPGARPTPGCAPSRPTSSASVAPTSRRSGPTTPTRATSSGCAPRCSTRSTSATSRSSCQDWGGLIGLRLVGEHPDRFARVVAANTFLPTGDRAAGRGVPRLAALLADGRGLPRRRHRQRRLHDRRSPRRRRRLRRAVPRRDLQGGRAPVPDARADHARRSGRRPRTAPAWEVLRAFERRSSPRSRTRTRSRAAAIASSSATSPGCAGQPHTTIDGGGHFLQEDRGEQLARVVAAFVQG